MSRKLSEQRPIMTGSRCITIRFPWREFDAIEELASQEGVERSTLVRHLVGEALVRHSAETAQRS